MAEVSSGAEVPPTRSFVVGTAGHVDHGKSTLVKALTGIDPDRLAEEKARAMTIDLGFAWVTLPGGREVSIVDVPGHERFIKNMLAGVGGIDAALLVIAADEGPMPQTAEHLAILDLLGVSRGVIVLTKADLVDDEWLDLVTEEVRQRIDSTSLAGAPIVPVSATTGRGLAELLLSLQRVLSESALPVRGGPPRLPVDRVFTVAGFGTVVTGTLSGGTIATGDDVQVYPGNRVARVRGLQSHQHKVSIAPPGTRTAVNLSGITTEEIRRGDVLAPPKSMTPTQRIDVRLRLLEDSPMTLKQNAEIDFFTGATELPAWATLLDRDTIPPGETGWVQLRFRTRLAVRKGDRFIVRRASPSETIGGGEVIDANPPRHQRFRPETVAALETLAAGSPDEIVLQAIESRPVEIGELRASVAGLTAGQIDAALGQLIAEGDVLVLGAGTPGFTTTDVVVATTRWGEIEQQLIDTLRRFHASNPLRPGMPREELRTRMGLRPPRVFDLVIGEAMRRGSISDGGATIRDAGFALVLDPTRQGKADAFLASLAANPLSPPSPHESGLDAESLIVLEHQGKIVRVGDGIYYTPHSWEQLTARTLAFIDDHGSITLAQFRDHFGTSRKYAQAALEQMDLLRYTRRIGDDRVRGPKRPGPRSTENPDGEGSVGDRDISGAIAD
ncbi:MAG: selenocysteine-specific translation elongation factor [Thermomicrobiales bacterium]